MNTHSLPRTEALLNQGIVEGLHPGAQLCVIRRGQILAELALGEARPGVPARPDSIMPWLSSGKPVTAVAVAQAVERGEITLETRVAERIPKFGQNGKESVTVEHLLTHTGGFRSADKLPDELDWAEALERICAAPLETDWAPGLKAGYHVSSSWLVLGELVRLIDGRAFGDYVREEIFLPLGMDLCWIGLPEESYARLHDQIGWMHRTDVFPPETELFWNTAAGARLCKPGGNARGPVRELARFYQMLLNGGELDGRRLLQAETVREFIRSRRVGMFDHTFLHKIDFGCGFILDSKQYGVETVPYGYGRHASGRAFGHSGSQSSCGFADPVQELVVTWVCNGMPGERRHQSRARALNNAIYEDLGLANSEE